MQFAAFRRIQQSIVRRSVPQEETQAGGKGPGVEPLRPRAARMGFRPIHDENEFRADQYGFQRQGQSRIEIFRLFRRVSGDIDKLGKSGVIECLTVEQPTRLA